MNIINIPRQSRGFFRKRHIKQIEEKLPWELFLNEFSY